MRLDGSCISLVEVLVFVLRVMLRLLNLHKVQDVALLVIQQVNLEELHFRWFRGEDNSPAFHIGNLCCTAIIAMLQALSSGSGPALLIGMIAAPVIIIVIVIVLAIVRARSRSRFQKRLEQDTKAHGAALKAKRGQQRRLLIEGKLDEIEAGRRKRSQRVTLKQQFEMAGLRLSERKFHLVCAAIGLVSFMMPVLFGIPVWAAFLLAICLGMGFPRFVLRHLREKRRRLFVDGFAEAVDIIVRGIQSGLPLGECISIIGREAPEPISGEFQMMIESTRLGLNLPQSLERATARMPVPEFKFFSIVLSIQQETGGNLAETLNNLAEILRGRKQMKDKIKAMSAEARTTAGIIGCLPFMMGTILFLVAPDYITTLFTSPLGQLMIAGGVVMLLVGSAVMAKMIAFKI